MLKRCSPRRISALVTGMGNSFDSLPSAPLPVASSVSSLRWPRATVPSAMGRAERPSVKKSLGRSGMYFGWSCMSWRQADSRRSERTSAQTETQWWHKALPCASGRSSDVRATPGCTRQSLMPLASEPRRGAPWEASGTFLVRNFRYLPGLQRLQELAGFVAIEERIGGFDAQEEPVPASLCEARHVERGVIGHGQAAQAEHTQNGCQRRKENGHFKGDDDVGGPTVQWPPADIDGGIHRSEEHTSELQSLR